jgi:hypothetical protein
MIKITKIFLIMLFLCYFIYVANAHTATVDAASCSASDVQSAIDAASDGDTVSIPSGTCTWSSAVDIPNTKGLTVIGAGEGSTNITISGTRFRISTSSSNSSFELASITFDATSCTGYNGGCIDIIGSDQSIIVHDITLDSMGARAFQVGYRTQTGLGPYGVFYNITCTDTTFAFFENDDDLSWSTANSFGGAGAVYIEDSIFDFASAHNFIDQYHGARMVFRYNTVTNGRIVSHGFCSSDNGLMQWEYYNNTFTAESGVNLGGDFIFLRGGSGVIHNNTFNQYDAGFTTHMVSLLNYRSEPSNSGLCSSGAPLDPTCDGDSSVYDTNLEPNGYICHQQPGTGTNDTSVPMYEWGNVKVGSGPGSIDFQIKGTRASTYHIIENRDYYNNTEKPGYSAHPYPHPLRYPKPPENLRGKSQ